MSLTPAGRAVAGDASPEPRRPGTEQARDCEKPGTNVDRLSDSIPGRQREGQRHADRAPRHTDHDHGSPTSFAKSQPASHCSSERHNERGEGNEEPDPLDGKGRRHSCEDIHSPIVLQDHAAQLQSTGPDVRRMPIYTCLQVICGQAPVAT
jgi:hypothetical protein